MNRFGMCMCDEYYQLPDIKGKRVLEVGCNTGKLAAHIVNNGAAHYLGIDIWPWRDEERKGLQTPELFERFKYGDVTRRESLPFNEHWDVVIMFDVLYHLTNPYQALTYLRDLTKGVLVLGTACDPANDCFMRFEPGYNGDVGNFWYPTEKCLLRIFNQLGLRPELKFYWEESKQLGVFHDRICIHGIT